MVRLKKPERHCECAPKSQQQLVRHWTSRKNGRLYQPRISDAFPFSLPRVVGIFGMVGAVFLATLQAAGQSPSAQSLPLIIAPQPRLGFTRMPGSTTDILLQTSFPTRGALPTATCSAGQASQQEMSMAMVLPIFIFAAWTTIMSSIKILVIGNFRTSPRRQGWLAPISTPPEPLLPTSMAMAISICSSILLARAPCFFSMMAKVISDATADLTS